MNTSTLAHRLFRGIAVLGLFFCSSDQNVAQDNRSTSKVGTTAGQFLKIGVGARALGMGGAQVSLLGDVSSLYWNAAALSRMDASSELTFTHAVWLADITHDFAGGVLNLGDAGVFGISIISLSVPDDIVRTVEYPEGDGRRWDAGSLAFGITYARNLTDKFSIGLQAKYIRESVWNESASAFALDFGTLYLSDVPGLRLGAAISNFGSRLQLDGRDLYFNNDPDESIGSGPNNIPAGYRTSAFDLPLIFRIGVSYDAWNADDLRLTVAADAVHPNDNTEYVNSGLEIGWSNALFARVGYKSAFLRNSEEGICWGLGFHYGIVNGIQIKLDYGFAKFGRLKNIQYITMGLIM